VIVLVADFAAPIGVALRLSLVPLRSKAVLAKTLSMKSALVN
jgi:hypothetical protein